MRTFCLVLFMAAVAAFAQDPFLLIGTYTSGGSEGVYVYRFNTRTGKLTLASIAKEIDNPSFLTASPTSDYVFVASQVDEGYVVSYRLDRASGEMTRLSSQPSGGSRPCHVSCDSEGKWLTVSNYSSGNMSVMAIGEDGRLGTPTHTVQHEGKSIHPTRQNGPYVHSAYFSPTQQQVFVSDLGIDQVVSYDFDRNTGKLSPAQPPFVATPAGSGPRHFVFHPNGRFGYSILELSSQVAAYAYEGDSLRELHLISTLPATFQGTSTCADIHISPDGKFLYGSNRGHNSIAIYRINPSTGHLTYLTHQTVLGNTPRNFAIDPSGKFLLVANQDSDQVLVFRRNSRNGTLKITKQSIKVSMPVCLEFK